MTSIPLFLISIGFGITYLATGHDSWLLLSIQWGFLISGGLFWLWERRS